MATGWNSFLSHSNCRLTVLCKELEPTREFNDTCRSVIADLRSFFTDYTKYDVANTIVAGSYKTGTAIPGISDVDMVIFLNDFYDMDDYMDSVEIVMEKLARELCEWHSNVEIVRVASKTMRIRIPTRDGDMVDVDLCPAFDILRWTSGMAEDVYRQMNKLQSHDERDFYSSSLTPLQLEFITGRIKNNQKAKSLIRLVKYWSKTYLPQMQISPPGVHEKPSPSSYCLELLTISLWEDAGCPKRFSLEVGLKCVLQQLANYGNITVYWDDHYKKSRYSNRAKWTHNFPYILDPVNPFDNVCVKCNNWVTVGFIARKSCNSPLLRHINVTDDW